MEEIYAKTSKGFNDHMDNLWVIPVIPGITCEKIITAMRTAGDVCTFIDYRRLDDHFATNNRDPAKHGPYSATFRRRVEADDEIDVNYLFFKLFSKVRNGMTLLERLLLEFGYFLSSKDHLDKMNVTFCKDSQHIDDKGLAVFPVVYCIQYGSGRKKVHVNWYNLENRLYAPSSIVLRCSKCLAFSIMKSLF